MHCLNMNKEFIWLSKSGFLFRFLEEALFLCFPLYWSGSFFCVHLHPQISYFMSVSSIGLWISSWSICSCHTVISTSQVIHVLCICIFFHECDVCMHRACCPSDEQLLICIWCRVLGFLSIIDHRFLCNFQYEIKTAVLIISKTFSVAHIIVEQFWPILFTVSS